MITDDLKWIAVVKIVNDQSGVIMVTIKVKGGDMNELKHRFYAWHNLCIVQYVEQF